MLLIMVTNYFRSVDVVKRDNSNYMQGGISQLKQTIAANSEHIVRILDTVAYNSQTVRSYFYIRKSIFRRMIEIVKKQCLPKCHRWKTPFVLLVSSK